MSKLVRIYNMNVDKQGEPFAICSKHLKALNSRLNGHCITNEIGTTKDKCQNCETEDA